jgi:hypothetical protein
LKESFYAFVRDGDDGGAERALRDV